jgi:hypothetical protein
MVLFRIFRDVTALFLMRLVPTELFARRVLVTAAFFNWAVPTLFLGRV